MLRTGLDTCLRAIGALWSVALFYDHLRPNHTHLGRYTRTVSLLRVNLAPLINTSFRVAAAGALCLMAACGSTPTPIATPTGPPVARPGTLAWSADWTTSPMGVALACGGPGLSDPFGCDLPPGARWGTLPQPGNGGQACVDPQPTVCFQPSGGALGFHAVTPGMALISSDTIPNTGTVSIRGVFTATNDCNTTTDVSFVGPVIYNGEGDNTDPTGGYLAVYLVCYQNSPITVNIYGLSHTSPIPSAQYQPGSTHSLRIDWTYGVSAAFLVDDVAVWTDYANVGGVGPLTLSRPPHPSVWFGAAQGKAGDFTVYVLP